MSLNSKASALAAGVVAALSAASLAQGPVPPPRPPIAATRSPGGETLVINGAENGGTIDWIEKSAISALREGVIKDMELQVGMEVLRGKSIGTLHDEMARLTVAKAQLAASNVASREKALAQKDLAIANLARLQRLNRIGNYVSKEEVEKAEAEVKVSAALILEAEENQKLARAELDLANQQLGEHTITAPFDGIIMERMKNPGESVRANEAVVQLGKIDKVRFFGYLPLESAYRVKVGMTVDVTPITESELPISKKRFRGKVTFVSPEVVPVRNQIQVFANVTNNVAKDLLPGLKANMIIYLDESSAPPPPADMLPSAAAPDPVLSARPGAVRPAQ
jgi:RND family efflux transporter MFP subunit